MAGIYIHIPFCKTRCIYCDFYKETDESQMDAFTEAICREAGLRRDEVKEPVRTIYFGGGTPSRLSRDHFEEIFKRLAALFQIDPDAEITLEANPDDLTGDYAKLLQGLPFNRISIGIQSFDDKELKFLSRRHSAQQAVSAVKHCRDAGFGNISIDLMYGLPGQTPEKWRENLIQACELDIEHISAYHLIYEKQTRLYTLLQRGRVQPATDETSREMFSMLIDMLALNRFEHYEISNFARNGKYSAHNTSYWKNERYLGLGPSAHSYDGESRSWNVASLEKYITAIGAGELPQERERLTHSQQYNEFVLTGLRTMWGVDLLLLKEQFGQEMYDYCLQNARKFIRENLLTIKENSLILSREGIFISDGIMSELMWVE